MPSLKHRGEQAGRAHWRSLDELAESKEFRQYLEAEFPSVAPLLESTPTRRHFLKVMGASLALGGLVGCRWPKEKILPYGKRPNGRLPGVPVQYATAIEWGGVGTGLLITSADGRPIKVEGNDQHAYSNGATNAFMQASILDLYDPDRAKSPAFRENEALTNASWADFENQNRARFEALRANGGAGLVVLCGASDSPSRAAMQARLRNAMPQAKWFEYEPLSRDNERVGTRLASGAALRSHLALDKPAVIASFDADFLQDHPANIRNTRDFAAGRTAETGDMHRLFVVESGLSLTGSNADYRFAERSSAIPLRLRQLAGALIELGRFAGDANAVAVLRGLGASDGAAPEYISAMAMNLAQAGERAAVVVGPRQPAAAHALAYVLNAALGANGVTVQYTRAPQPDRPTHLEAIQQFAEALRGAADQTVVILGGNPVYNAPADLDLSGLLRQHYTIFLADAANETAVAAQWLLNQAHYLEAWSDARAFDGTVSIVQPLIEPMFGGRSAIELLALVLGDSVRSGYDIVRRTFREQFAVGDAFEPAWRRALHDGLIANTDAERVAPRVAVSAEALRSVLADVPALPDDQIEFVFAADNTVYDGRFANNGWLQEFPDPITKLVWDNAALISIADANRMGVQRGDELTIDLNGESLTVPAFPVPGQAQGSVTLPLGYGRTAGGAVLQDAGFNAYAARKTTGFDCAGGSVREARGSYKLVTTQDHHAIQSEMGDQLVDQRVPELVREGSLLEYKKDPGFVKHRSHELPLVQPFDAPEFEGKPRWAMAIDLSKCTGCGSCVVACQAENNVPVVGKEEVGVGREMHWLRIDRYFRGSPEEPQAVSHQPVACQHCENAPCEQVCPVAATVHDEQGLNVMVYNRCIGTRYCANNCPYKVRRFNWFWNHHGPAHPRSDGVWDQKEITKLEMMQHNPEVTVRSRGVMEKCTFCVQRIQNAQITAKNEKRPVRDGEVIPACAQACPADAIAFGDLTDTDSRIAKQFGHKRSYAMLGYLNVRPRNVYLARLKHVEDEHYGQGSHGGHGNGKQNDLKKHDADQHDADPAHS